ncbi:TetR/AcrR family transcriptional regulator [Ktedonosporobacter rubrisoli]|uniref:TetR/AcrR family transcriptional regulator n=1 Tax=Ktedonosporobacter rubrisoli TaxID=2509675 RepID=A0A4P6K5W9_KTERU|nr:TetR/AcrR family transcriptional regulator [Ktedonosporobacter rubrisoli]QBD83290.1 TetR/AcrR family transcriptional regulator [Ktedonosporobacter rubrisoli]
MAATKRRMDRRVQRTRQMLQQAFVEVVREKGFAATSIQDITDRANVNRGTFYLHFADKYMLVEEFIREDFQHLMERILPPAARWDRRTLHLLIESMLSYFERKYQHQQHVPPALAPLIERAIHEELTALLLRWLRQSESEVRLKVPKETIARVVSWAIFGSVIQWSQEESTTSLAQMTQDILLVIAEGVGHLAPEVLPE